MAYNEDGIDDRFTTVTVNDVKTSKAHYLSLKELREFIKKVEELDDNIPVLYENISENLLTGDTGWEVIPMDWEMYADKVQYSPCIPAWQIYVTNDKNGDKAIVLTAHY